MKISHSLLLVALLVCGCKHSTKENRQYSTNQDTVSISKESSIKSVEIPRSHLGITLGMSYPEAKNILLSNVCKGLDEEVDNVHKGILVKERGDWLGDWGNKYSSFYVEVFDGKVYSISLEPYNNPAEVIEALKQKYPFNVENNEKLRYHGNGLVTKNVKKHYSYSNGKTEIYFDESSYMIRYRDVKLKEVQRKYWEEVETLSKAQQQEDVNQQLSNY